MGDEWYEVELAGDSRDGEVGWVLGPGEHDGYYCVRFDDGEISEYHRTHLKAVIKIRV